MLCQEAKSTHYNVRRVMLFGWIKCVKCQINVCACKSYINAMLAWWLIIATVLVGVALTFWFETNLDAFSIGNREEKKWDWQFRGIVQPKMKTLSSFTLSHVVLNLYDFLSSVKKGKNIKVAYDSCTVLLALTKIIIIIIINVNWKKAENEV